MIYQTGYRNMTMSRPEAMMQLERTTTTADRCLGRTGRVLEDRGSTNRVKRRDQACKVVFKLISAGPMWPNETRGWKMAWEKTKQYFGRERENAETSRNHAVGQ